MTLPELSCKEDKQHIVLNATMKIQERLLEIERATKDCKLPDMGIRIKDIAVFYGIIAVRWHPKLVEVVTWADQQYPKLLVFTSAHRPGPGVHGTDPLRAIDLRSRHFIDPVVVCDNFNDEWDYGKSPYKVCVCHDSGQGIHFHIQVRDETKRRP